MEKFFSYSPITFLTKQIVNWILYLFYQLLIGICKIVPPKGKLVNAFEIFAGKLPINYFSTPFPLPSLEIPIIRMESTIRTKC